MCLVQKAVSPDQASEISGLSIAKAGANMRIPQQGFDSARLAGKFFNRIFNHYIFYRAPGIDVKF